MIIRRIVTTILMCYILSSCKDTGDVKLELINSKIYFIDKKEELGSYNKGDERKRSETIVTYTISNTTSKKKLFVFDPQHLQPSIGVSPSTQNYGYIGYFIRNDDGEVKKIDASSIMFAVRGDLTECVISDLDRKREMYQKLGIRNEDIINVDNYINHAVVVCPGESRTFQAVVSLPIINEVDKRRENSPSFYRNLTENDKFGLFYFCKARELKQSLPKYLQDELEKNDIEIFDGILTAPAVKLQKRL